MKVEVAVLGPAPRPNEPYGFCGRKACESEFSSCVKVEVAVLGPAPRPNEPYCFCGRKATLNHAYRHWSQFVPNMSTRHPRT